MVLQEEEFRLLPCASPTSDRKSKRVASSVQEQPCIPYQDAAGEIVRLRAIGPFTLSEHVYPAGMVLARHAHRDVYFTFVLEGSFREKSGNGTLVCRPGTIRFLPAGELHEDVIETRLRCLHIKAEAPVLEELDRHSVVPRRPAEISGLTATWLANRLYTEFSREDCASSIAVEGLVLEILAELARVETKPQPALVPNWLKHATDIVESRFLERLSLAEIASEVGVHYVHLSRQFHKYNRCTIGDLIRRRRVQHASHLLAHSRTPLAEIALICGFSDQSHLSFLFKRYMGLSPSKFRHLSEQESMPRQARLRSFAGVAGK